MATNKKLSATITIGGALSGTLQASFGTVKTKLNDIGRTVSDLTKRQKLLGRTIQEFGRAGKNVDGLRNSYARLTDQIERATRAQKRLAAAQKFKDKADQIGGALRGAAMRTGATGVAMGGILYTGIAEAKRQQSEEARVRGLGFSQHDSDELLDAAKKAKAFGVSTKDATETARDLATAFGDVHHAVSALPMMLKQRTALSLYDQGHGTNLAEHAAYAMAKVIELRNGTKSEDEFRKQANYAHQVLVATGGRVTAEEMQHAIRTGGIAAKAMNDEAFYYGGSALMQEMGGDTFGTASMSLYQALAQGRVTKRAAQNLEKFGLIGDKSKVTEDKAGQLKFMNPGALMGYSTFTKDPQAWVEKYFIPALKKNGIDPDDMTKVAEVAGMIVSNRTGANLLATRVAQRNVIAKEAANAKRADNIDTGFDRSKETAAAKELQAEARLADLKLRIGTVIMPVYISALEKVATALEAVNKFAEENPTLMKAVVIGFTSLAAGLVVVTPLLMTASGILSAMALIKLAGAVTQVNAMNAAINGTAGAATGVIGKLGGLVGKLGLLGIAIETVMALTPEVNKGKGTEDIKNGDWWNASWDLSAGDFVQAGWRKAKGWSNEDIAKGINNPDHKPTQLPQVPAPRSSLQQGYVDNSQNTYHVTTQPGQDPQSFAKAMIAEQERQRKIKQRGRLHDGADQ